MELATLPLKEEKPAAMHVAEQVSASSEASASQASHRSSATDEKAASLYSSSPPRSVLPLQDAESAARLRTEACGFTLYLLMTLLALLWLLWALLPDRALRALGVGWYPARCVAPGRTASSSEQC